MVTSGFVSRDRLPLKLFAAPGLEAQEWPVGLMSFSICPGLSGELLISGALPALPGVHVTDSWVRRPPVGWLGCGLADSALDRFSEQWLPGPGFADGCLQLYRHQQRWHGTLICLVNNAEIARVLGDAVRNCTLSSLNARSYGPPIVSLLVGGREI